MNKHNLKSVFIFIFSFLTCVVPVFADGYRADKALLGGILTFMKSGSVLVLVVGIGMLIMSFADERGDQKVTAAKWIGVAIGMFALPTLAGFLGLM